VSSPRTRKKMKKIREKPCPPIRVGTAPQKKQQVNVEKRNACVSRWDAVGKKQMGGCLFNIWEEKKGTTLFRHSPITL